MDPNYPLYFILHMKHLQTLSAHTEGPSQSKLAYMSSSDLGTWPVVWHDNLLCSWSSCLHRIERRKGFQLCLGNFNSVFSFGDEQTLPRVILPSLFPIFSFFFFPLPSEMLGKFGKQEITQLGSRRKKAIPFDSSVQTCFVFHRGHLPAPKGLLGALTPNCQDAVQVTPNIST